ncbi:MAG: imidazolonepropionase [Alphaproteobacteria bacterium]|nr:imidazolonepropionase [Alphaproteobacteria bacterium]
MPEPSAESRLDILLLGGHLATMAQDGPAGREPYGAIRDGAIGIAGRRIAWIGPARDLPDRLRRTAGAVFDLEGRWATPGLIDCHTHLVFAGERIGDFEARLSGRSYAEIAQAGGGILSTVRATRATDEEGLMDLAVPRLSRLMMQGVTTIEIKSGYGLDRETELRQLRVARAIGHVYPVTVRATYLAAHAVPPEHKGRPDSYIDQVIAEILPEVKQLELADAVDGYLEPFTFNAAQLRRLYAAAQAVGLPVKLHADQLGDGDGAALAAETGCISADHLEYASAAGVRALAASGTVAVLLPGAYHMLRQDRPPPVPALRDAGVAMAVATDCNPGTSPCSDPLLAMNMACLRFGLTPEEALAGMTRNAARALGLHDERGTLAVGKAADVAVWDVTRPAELCYWMGSALTAGVMREGQWSLPLKRKRPA